MGDRDRAVALLGQLLRLDPHNPTVYNDFLRLAEQGLGSETALGLIDALKSELAEDDLAQANCDFYAGNLLSAIDPLRAIECFKAARWKLRTVLPPEDPVFRLIGQQLRALRRNPQVRDHPRRAIGLP